MLFFRRYGVHGAFLEFLCWNWCSYKLKTWVSGNFGSCLKKSSHVTWTMGITELFWSQCRGIGLNLELIWATTRYFRFLRWHQCSSRLVSDVWVTLCTSIKQIKAPYLFDWEKGIALHAVQGNQASSFSEREVWWFFSSCSGKLVYVLELRRGKTLKTVVCSATSGLLSSYNGHLRNLN